jgi:hypothetical protein
VKKVKRKKRTLPVNKKVRNAQKIFYDNIQFQSRLELHCYKKLKEAKLEFEYEPISFELIPKLKAYPKDITPKKIAISIYLLIF